MIPVARPELPAFEAYERLLAEIWQSHMLSNFADHAQALEVEAARYLGAAHVRAVVNGDLGLMLALAALDLPEGGECLVPSFTFNSSPSAILWNRLVPVFCDIDPETFNLDPAQLPQRLSARTVAILSTHVFGNPCDAEGLRAIAAEKGIPLLFDAAHAYGSLYRGRKVGTLGDLEVFSLSGTKPVTSAEGGLISTGRAELAERLLFGRNYGFFGDYNSRFPGINAKMSELHAALGRLTLATVEEAVRRRNAIAARYRENLKRIEGISFQKVDGRDRSTFKDFAILCPHSTEALAAHLAAHDVQTKRYFLPAHRMDFFRRFARGGLPHTEAVYEKILCLPIYNELPLAEVDRISQRVAEFYRRR